MSHGIRENSTGEAGNPAREYRENSNLIFLWSAPRSLSTAFSRMMMERGDYLVVHEPFSSIVVLGHVVIGGEKVTSHGRLLQALQELAKTRRVFVKETTEYRYAVAGDPLLATVGVNSFLIRDPRPVLASHYAMNPEVVCSEVGFEHLAELYDTVCAELARTPGAVRPIVVEAESLVADPVGTVSRYCACVGIPFMGSALSWEPGDRSEWSRTPEWHVDAAQSSCFSKRPRNYTETTDSNATLKSYYEYHLPFYERLHAAALKHSRAR